MYSNFLRKHFKLPSELIIQLVLDTPLEQVFDYLWSGEQLPKIGQFALVNFGHREVVGLIVGIKQESQLAREKLKSIIFFTSKINLKRNIIAYFDQIKKKSLKK